MLIEKFGCDTLLLDDGFQYWKLRGRRQDVVLIDCQQPFGNQHLLPRAAPSANPPPTWPVPPSFSSPKATATPARSGNASPR